ncbi:hypothetical protein CEXT_279531 [Caerostris extrusa]|uniref:Uncharacterized protein n=1 Tax=Caerostris extrusa TaxID=172846 RepID=A0AAV4XRA1_CAEEX|nr:hypothetical protein CEXT_279531 [Caerostris extrusa]
MEIFQGGRLLGRMARGAEYHSRGKKSFASLRKSFNVSRDFGNIQHKQGCQRLALAKIIFEEEFGYNMMVHLHSLPMIFKNHLKAVCSWK